MRSWVDKGNHPNMDGKDRHASWASILRWANGWTVSVYSTESSWRGDRFVLTKPLKPHAWDVAQAILLFCDYPEELV